MTSQDWFALHAFCICHVIVNNAIIDFTLVKIFYKLFDKCSVVMRKIVSVIKKVKKIRVVLIGSWLVLFICYFAAYQVAKAREKAARGEMTFGTAETYNSLLVDFEDRHAGITLSVLVIIPTVVLGLQLILLHVMTYTPPPEIWGEKKEKEETVFPIS